jgi:hypothetical protein
MRKSICCLLTVSLIIGMGCNHETAPPKPEDRLERARRLQRERDEPDTSDNDQSGLVLVAVAVITVVSLPFVLIGDQIKRARGDTPAKAAHEMDDPNASPDTHRQGIADLVTTWKFTHHPPYTTRYKQIAEQDPNVTVRAMAIRALNISRDHTATPIFIAALEDDDELIRLEGAKALANIPDPNAIPALLRRVEGKRETIRAGQPQTTDESKDVRIAAAAALRHYHTLEVARTLVNQLDSRDFGVAWQSNQSLIELTGQDFAYNESAWFQYLTGPSKPFG